MFVNPLGYWTGPLAVGQCKHGAKTTSPGYWTGLLAVKQCRVHENLCKKLWKTSLQVLYSNLELLDRIKTSEWVKWQPCRGYGRLLAAVAMPTVLKILSLKSWLADLKGCHWFASFETSLEKIFEDDVSTIFGCYFLSWNSLWWPNLDSLLLTEITASPSVSPLLAANSHFFSLSHKLPTPMFHKHWFLVAIFIWTTNLFFAPFRTLVFAKSSQL